MKKTLSIILTLFLAVSVIFAFAACTSDNPGNNDNGGNNTNGGNNDPDKHPIAAFWEELNSADSYQFTFTTHYGEDSSVTVTYLVDGNIECSISKVLDYEMRTYTEKVGNVVYTYTQDVIDGTWTKTQSAAEGYDYSLTNLENMKVYFTSSYFEKVDGKENTYKIKDAFNSEGSLNFEVTVGEDSYTINSVVDGEGIIYVYSNVNEVDLTLPNVE